MMIKTRNEYIQEWKLADTSGSLLTPKHDPNGKIVYDKYRTVLTPEFSSSLHSFID